MNYCSEIGISKEKCGGQNLELFQISNQWKKYKYPELGISNEKWVGPKTWNIFKFQIQEKSILGRP